MKRGRFIKYDKQRVLEQIVGGKLSAQEIAIEHKITRGMVYTLKYQAKRRNIIRDPVQRLDDLDSVEPRGGGVTQMQLHAKFTNLLDSIGREFFLTWTSTPRCSLC